MPATTHTATSNPGLTLVLGATGKTGRRVAARLAARKVPIRLGSRESGAPREVVWLLDYLLSTVLDGRNAQLSDGIQRALGRAPRDFADYAADTAGTGIWSAAA